MHVVRLLLLIRIGLKIPTKFDKFDVSSFQLSQCLLCSSHRLLFANYESNEYNLDAAIGLFLWTLKLTRFGKLICSAVSIEKNRFCRITSLQVHRKGPEIAIEAISTNGEKYVDDDELRKRKNIIKICFERIGEGQFSHPSHRNRVTSLNGQKCDPDKYGSLVCVLKQHVTHSRV